jgi:hypothetical protein
MNSTSANMNSINNMGGYDQQYSMGGQQISNYHNNPFFNNQSQNYRFFQNGQGNFAVCDKYRIPSVIVTWL